MPLNLLKLAGAKFPPEQTPALLKDLEALKDTISTINLNPELRAGHDAVIEALRAVKEQLTTQQQFDSVLVDADFDAAGYGIHDIIDGKERVATAHQLPLTEKLTQQLSDVKRIRALFILDNAQGKDIFRLPYQEEYNAIEIVLSRTKTPEAKAAINRLSLPEDFERLTECHEVLRRLLGIGVAGVNPGDPTQKTAFARFEEAIKQLIFAVGLFASKETDEHRRIRQVLLGAYEKHVNTYRERQRKYAEANQKKADALLPERLPPDEAVSD
jgi:hypothetical protein